MTIKITWLGTACYVLDLDGTKLMFDPFFFRQTNEKATPVLKTKREDVKNISAIFITHGHFDHCTDAGWFAENRGVSVYCSETAKDNTIRWAGGEIIEDHSYSLTDKGKNNIKPIDYFDKIKINENITVEAIKSEHIKFDMNTILSRLFSWKVLKQIKKIIPYGKGFPMGKVFGFCIYYKDIKMVSFGSLWHEYGEILENYQNCDIFLAPLAGNSKKHIAKKGGIIINFLKPKIVIPYHWDDFFPPISRTENLKPFFKHMKKEHPEIKILNLNVDEETTINL